MSEQVSLASVVYNMAGQESDRPQYLKTLIIQNLFSKSKETMGETIQRGLLKGPAMRLRSFYRWTQRPGNYSLIGTPLGNLQTGNSLPRSLVAAALGIPEGDVGAIYIGPPEPTWFVVRWCWDQSPVDMRFEQNFLMGLNLSATVITTLFEDLSIEYIPVIAPFYDTSDWYFCAAYDHTGLLSPGYYDKIWIYRPGGGHPSIDALINTVESGITFFPFIPIRLDNQFLSLSHNPTAYGQAKKAYSKVTGGAKIEDLIATIADNPDLGDIDYAYIVFGVPLNVVENTARKYLYTFFEALRLSQLGGTTALADWLARGRTNTPNNHFTVEGPTALSAAYKVRVKWKFIHEYNLSGLGKVGANVGDVWFVKNGYVTVPGEANAENLLIYWQNSTTTHKVLALIGMVHENYIYKSMNIKISSFAAIDDVEESGFIVPLHNSIWQDMSLVDASQMSTACMFVVFNCYSVYKEQWYDHWLFRIFLVVVIAVISVMFTGGAGLGILGPSLALGTSLGFTGITAAIVGSIVNALAAMVVVSLLQPLIDQAGPAGPIIAAILMFAIGQAAGSLNSMGTLSINWGDLLRVDNLLAMTNAVGQGISGQMGRDTLGVQQQTLDYVKRAQDEANKIQQAFFEKFGYGGGIIDPLMLVDAPQGPIIESSDTFLTRTLMTGSEIAEMSRELLYEFPSHSLRLPNAFT